MRVNVYAEELTDQVEIITKTNEEGTFTGVRFYLHLPVTVLKTADGEPIQDVKGPFIHRKGDDDSSAVTFWGKRDLRDALLKAIELIDEHYAKEDAALLS